MVALSDSAKQFIVDNGYDPVYGARPLKRYLQKNVETLAAPPDPVGWRHTGDTIRIDVVDGKLNASAERNKEYLGNRIPAGASKGSRNPDKEKRNYSVPS